MKFRHPVNYLKVTISTAIIDHPHLKIKITRTDITEDEKR